MRAAIYARQSLDKSGEALAVSRQLTECRDLVARKGWEVAEVYQDNDRSATSGKIRPEWRRLLADLKSGQYDVLVCWHTDRLYRRLRDLVELVEIAEKRSLRIATVKASDLDLSTPSGRMVASLLGSVASYEGEQKAARQIAANRQRAQSGVVLWTRRPFGFERDGTEVTAVKSEAAEIRKAAHKVLTGATLASVADDMNRRGVTTTARKHGCDNPSTCMSAGRRNTADHCPQRRSLPWTVTAVRRVLLNPRTSGRVVSKGEDYGGTGPVILKQETADKVGALLRHPGRKSAPPSTEVKYLLSGLAHCGRDDERMYATSNAQGVMVYRCRQCYSTRRLDLVDEVVMGVLIARLSRPDALSLLHSDVDFDVVRKRLIGLRERRDGLASLLADGLLSPIAVRTQAEKLKAEIEALERTMMDESGSEPLSRLAHAEDVVAVLESLSLVGVRDVLRALLTVRILPAGKGIRFSPEQVAIKWSRDGDY